MTTTIDLTVCTYERGPAATVRTGKTGHQYALCADCADFESRTDAVAAIMEDFRTRLREAGQLTEDVDQFVNEVIICAPLSKGTDPLAMISTVFQHLSRRHGGVCGV